MQIVYPIRALPNCVASKPPSQHACGFARASLALPLPVAMDQADEDDVGSVSCGSSKGRTNYGLIMLLPLLWINVKERECTCCGESSHFDSPFLDATEDDTWGGKHPWQRYVICPWSPNFKMVHGKLCLICWQVFKMLGLHLVHGTVAKYLGSATIRLNPEDHRSFMRSVKTYISEYNNDPMVGIKMLTKKVNDARVTVDEEERKGTKLIRRRTFILEKVFLEIYASTPEFKNKAMEKDTHFVSRSTGLQSGYWVPGSFNSHLPGHFEYEDYEDTSAVLRKRHEDGSLVLSKDQAATKFDALTKIHGESHSRIQQKLNVFTALDLIKMASGSGGSSSASKPAGENSSAVEVGSVSEDEGDDASGMEDDDPNVDGRSSSLFGRMRCSSAAAASSAVGSGLKKGGGGGGSGGRAGGGGGGGGGRAGGGGGGAALSPAGKTPDARSVAIAKAPPSGGSAVVNVVTDGRFHRLKEGLVNELDKIRAAMHEMDISSFVDEDKTIGVGTAFVTQVKAKVKPLTASINALKGILGRIDRSTNKEMLSSESEVGNQMLDAFTACLTLVKTVTTAQPSAADVVQAVSEAKQLLGYQVELHFRHHPLEQRHVAAHHVWKVRAGGRQCGAFF